MQVSYRLLFSGNPFEVFLANEEADLVRILVAAVVVLRQKYLRILQKDYCPEIVVVEIAVEGIVAAEIVVAEIVVPRIV